MDRIEEIKDRARAHDDTDIEDRDWMIAEIDRLHTAISNAFEDMRDRICYELEIADLNGLLDEVRAVYEKWKGSQDVSLDIYGRWNVRNAESWNAIKKIGDK